MPVEYVNYRDFAQILWCPKYVYLQRFYGASSLSIYRDWVDFMVPGVCQFTEILLRFYGAPSMSIYIAYV